MGKDWALVAILFTAVVGVTALAIAWSVFQQKRRAGKMAETAETLGFSFEPDGRTLLDESITDISIFSLAQLGSGKIVNLMRGKAGSLPVAICDYHYWTGRVGGGRRDRQQTVICFDVRGARLPDFSLLPRRSLLEHTVLATELKISKTPQEMWKPALDELRTQVLNTALNRMEDKGPEFPSDPELSKIYHLRAAELEAVKSLFDSGLLEVLRQQRKPLLSIEKAGRWLVVYRKGVRVRPDRIEDALAEANELGSRLIRT